MVKHIILAAMYAALAALAYLAVHFGLALLPASKFLGVAAVCGGCYVLLASTRMYYGAAMQEFEQ